MTDNEQFSTHEFAGTSGHELPDPGRPLHLHVIPYAPVDWGSLCRSADIETEIQKEVQGLVAALEAEPARTCALPDAAGCERIRQTDPELFRRLVKLVTSGRCFPVGGEWCAVDPAVPGAEARIRSFFYGQRFFQEHFRRIAHIAWSMGGMTMHPNSLPQILQQAGVDAFVHKYPHEIDGHVPMLPYRWEGIDGSQVLACRCGNSEAGLPSLSLGHRREPGFGQSRSELEIIADCFIRAGLSHLCGIQRIVTEEDFRLPLIKGPVEVHFSSPETFFEQIRKQKDTHTLRCRRASLPRACMGLLAVRQRHKTLNRRIEHKLLEGETLLGMLHNAGLSVNPLALDPLWQQLLSAQACISAVAVKTDNAKLETQLDELWRQSCDLRDRQLERLADHLTNQKHNDNVRTKADAVLICNPLGWTRSGPVSVQIRLRDSLKSSLSGDLDLKDQTNERLVAISVDGSETPVRIAASDQPPESNQVCIEFQADSIPGFGYQAFALGSTQQTLPRVQQQDNQIQTGTLTASMDRDRGGIQLLAVDQARFESRLDPLGSLVQTETGAYPGHCHDNQRFRYTGFTGHRRPLRPSECHERGLLGGGRALCFRYQVGSSILEQEFRFMPNAGHIDVRLTGNWQELESYLQIQISFAPDKQAHCFADLPYGWTEALPDGDEHPMQYVCGMRDQHKAIAILNNAHCGCRWHEGTLTVSVARATEPSADISGSSEIMLQYRILPIVIDPMDWPSAALRAGCEYNRPLIAHSLAGADGGVQGVGRFWHHEPQAVLSTALKPAHDGDGLIIRTLNPGGKVADRLSVMGAELTEADDFLELPDTAEGPIRGWRPWEIKTIRCRKS